jgi:Protein of unknown function (DUF3102)
MADTLEELAFRANESHKLAVESVSKALKHAIAAGTALIAAKKKVTKDKWGGWGKWIDENFDGSQRTAQVYMQLARSNPQRSADSDSIAKALKVLGKPTPSRKVNTPRHPAEAVKTRVQKIIESEDVSVIQDLIEWLDEVLGPFRRAS